MTPARARPFRGGCRICTVVGALLLVSSPAAGQVPLRSWGIRGTFGGTIQGDIYFGGQVNFRVDRFVALIEIGALGQKSSLQEVRNELHSYVEYTELATLGLMASFLFGYDDLEPGPFAAAGIGVGAIRLNWRESSSTDTSLGERLQNGGSQSTAEGTSAGLVFEGGVGYAMGGGVDARLTVPVIWSPDPPGGARSTFPAVAMSLGLRF